jgi:hypothetical protein
MHRFQLVPVWVEDDGRVVALTVVSPDSRTPSAVRDGGGMKLVDRIPRRCNEGQVKA